MNNRCYGRLLRVNLTKGTTNIEEIPEEDLRAYIGARGLASKLLYDEVDIKADPLSKGNRLLFTTGPLTGTTAPSSSRYIVVTRSPLTGAIAGSNSGGYFPAEMRFAGIDSILFEGKAPEPVYLWIENDRAVLRSAKHLWGKSTHETDTLIREETDYDAKVSCIGPAGEKLVRFACVINDKNRAAGRSGVGAVMGSKNLKAVAIRGTKGVRVADPKAFREAALKARTKIAQSPMTSQEMPTFGTASIMNFINEQGLLPTKNFQTSVFEKASKISGEALRESILIRNKGCMGCPIACGRVTRVKTPAFEGAGEGPEYETCWAFGATCGVESIEAVAKANYICNELGMDTIEAGATIAAAMELFENDHLPVAEVGELLNFGNSLALVNLVEKIGRREDFGDVLAEGAYRLASHYGHPEFFMGVKGQSFPAYDPRAAQGMGIQYATSNRGACHVRGFTVDQEIFGVPFKVDASTTEGKAQLDKDSQDFTAALDSTGMCMMAMYAVAPEDLLDLLNCATGFGYTLDEFILTGERIWNIERLFNLKAGFTSKDDTLPKRILEEPLPSGPFKGQVNLLPMMLSEYYKLRGWDEEGRPTKEKLTQLGLK